MNKLVLILLFLNQNQNIALGNILECTKACYKQKENCTNRCIEENCCTAQCAQYISYRGITDSMYKCPCIQDVEDCIDKCELQRTKCLECCICIDPVLFSVIGTSEFDPI